MAPQRSTPVEPETPVPDEVPGDGPGEDYDGASDVAHEDDGVPEDGDAPDEVPAAAIGAAAFGALAGTSGNVDPAQTALHAAVLDGPNKRSVCQDPHPTKASARSNGDRYRHAVSEALGIDEHWLTVKTVQGEDKQFYWALDRRAVMSTPRTSR